MAQRRMFSLTVVDTDRFLEMPTSTQALYFHLGMRADDDGFVSSPKRILRTIGGAEDDLKLLVSKGLVIPFESGVCVITDWRQNNYIRSDRYTSTVYIKEKAELSTLPNESYSLGVTDGIPTGNQMVDAWSTQDSIGKDSIGEGSIKEANASCAEPSPGGDAPHRNPIITLPLNDKTVYPLFEEQMHEWAALYPAVDVIQQLRNMKGWLDANPTKRKTRHGIQRFINSWLTREQDKGGQHHNMAGGGGTNDSFNPERFAGFHIAGESDE